MCTIPYRFGWGKPLPSKIAGLLPKATSGTETLRQSLEIDTGAPLIRVRMEKGLGEWYAKDLHRMVSCRISSPLALEVSARTTSNITGTAHPHSSKDARQSLLG
ncbi:MAG TPA: hypothetical protein PKK23_19800 [Nitrospirales bacterium]|nr:hypothetical protein [Nitrospirales bacterium]